MKRRTLGLSSLLLLPLALASAGCIIPIIDFDFGRASALEEKVIREGEGPKIVVLDIDGYIGFEAGQRLSLAGPQPGMVARTREALSHAAADEVAALLLRLRTPGGSVPASETIYHLVQQWKQETGRPVVAFGQGVAASGGYYIATAADEIIVLPSSITGSIGVVFAGVNLSGLMERFGVEEQVIVSGPFKDTGSFLRPMRDEERAQLQSVIDDFFQRFVDVVDAGRSQLDRDQVLALADGRIYTSNQALAAGLVDSIGQLEDAIAATEQRAGIRDAKVVTYRAAREYTDNLYSRAGNGPTTTTHVEILSLPTRGLEPGFYYLWPAALH